jgi:hypothetical protein
MIELLADVYKTFFRQTVLHDMHILRTRFCRAVAMDETYKIAKKVKLHVPDSDTYRQAHYSLHTMTSLETGQVCALQWLEDNTAESKRELLAGLFQEQAGSGQAGRKCQYVCTDDAAKDEGFVWGAAILNSYEPNEPKVGDDLWHSKDRITRTFNKQHGKTSAVRKDLDAVYGLLSDIRCTVSSFQDKLRAWISKHRDVLSSSSITAANNQADKAEYLLNWQIMPIHHNIRIRYNGTLPNERWHYPCKKLLPYAPTVRIDHMNMLIEWEAFNWNCSLKERARTSDWFIGLSPDDKTAWNQIFTQFDYLPKHINCNTNFLAVWQSPIERKLQDTTPFQKLFTAEQLGEYCDDYTPRQ